MATSNRIIASRRHDLDNLRTFLTALVIAHHTALVYGGSGSVHIRNVYFVQPSPILIAINAINQSFFMGTFFWISGRMSAQSLSKTIPSRFVLSKLIRLGIPTIVCTLFIQPLGGVVALRSWDFSSISSFAIGYWKETRGVRGQVWYTATLLCFDCTTALITWWLASLGKMKWRDGMKFFMTSDTVKTWAWVVVSTASFLIRLRYPLSKKFIPLNLAVGYLPQYIYAYLDGFASFSALNQQYVGAFDRIPHRRTWAGSSHSKTTRDTGVSKSLSLHTAIALSTVTLSLVGLPLFIHGSGDLAREVAMQCVGGWNPTAVLYAVWNEFSFTLITPALMASFQEWYNKPTKNNLFHPKYSYGAFLFHWIILISTEVVVMGRSGAVARLAEYSMPGMIGRLLLPVVFASAVSFFNIYGTFVLTKLLFKLVPGVSMLI
jgi:glucans biosynthesis protein C